MVAHDSSWRGGCRWWVSCRVAGPSAQCQRGFEITSFVIAWRSSLCFHSTSSAKHHKDSHKNLTASRAIISFIFGKSKRQVGGIGGQRVFGRQDVDASVLPFHKIHDPGPVVRRKSVTFAAMDIANARSNGRGVVERIVESFDQQLSRRHARHQQEVERWRNANY